MPATVTLASTTLAAELLPGDRLVKLAAPPTNGIITGTCLFIENELVSVVAADVPASGVVVLRGQGGTTASYHEPGATVYIGTADQFYRTDPTGSPGEVIPVSPWINVVGGSIWFAQGDPLTGQYRWWQRQTMTPGIGPLGVRTRTYDPTSST